MPAFDCTCCENSRICRQKEAAQELQSKIKALKEKYPHFYGRIRVDCDYFASSKQERGVCDVSSFGGV